MASRDRPLRADAARNRAKVLEAATRTFGEQGVDAPIPEIARRAGVGIGTVYRQFPSKHDLLVALAAERYAWLAEQIERAASDADPWEGFTRVLWKAAAVQVADRSFRQVMREVATVPELEPLRLRVVDAIARLLERAQAAGVVRDDVTPQDLPVVMSGIGATVDATDRESGSWERHLAILVDGLRPEGAHALPTQALGAEQVGELLSDLPRWVAGGAA